jgi:hypothetical protein
MKKLAIGLLSLVVASVIGACSSQKDPADQAIKGAETALAAVRDEAQKYVPDQLKAVDSQIAAAKDSFAKGDYASALASAPKITAAIGDLKSAAAAKKAEAEAALAKAKDDWAAASAELPKMVEAIQNRVNTLSKSHRLPAGVTKDGLASAKSGLDGLKSTLSDATSAATSGDFTAAMAKAGDLKAKAADIMKSIGMKTG